MKGRRLGELVAGIDCQYPLSAADQEISGITADSRQVGAGMLFVAVSGSAVDGHRFIPEAVRRGCAAVVVEKGRRWPASVPEVPAVAVADTQAVLGPLAAVFYGNPAEELRLIGITGTNGKTTSSYLLEAVIAAGGGRPGIIGTVEYRFAGTARPAPLTTPAPVMLQRLLREMVDNGVTHVVMEVSSHAVAQKRLEGLRFDMALFTNLSRDHLDYHGDMERYFAAKAELFRSLLKESGQAVVVTGEPEPGEEGDWGWRLAELLAADDGWRSSGRRLLTCGMDRRCDIHPRRHRLAITGIEATVATPAGDVAVQSGLVGGFNLRNIMGATGIGVAMGLSPAEIGRGIGAMRAVPGRMERVPTGRPLEILVDYAHTPAALENVLTTLRELRPARLIVVFGCGGDRDPGKRPLMGAIAGRLADITLVTSDNPRSESPQAIAAAVEGGLEEAGVARSRAEALLGGRPGRRGYDVILSRREAIRLAVRRARRGDVVLIGGKGHETYQITAQGKVHFDDRQEAARELAVIGW